MFALPLHLPLILTLALDHTLVATRADASVVSAGPPRLVVQLPAFRLDYFEGTARHAAYPIAVGKLGHTTPAGTYQIREAIWNPWWHPPASAWAKQRVPVKPGHENPMGRVKLRFGDLLYIHGTPDEPSMGSAASHGCIRMRNGDVVALARRVTPYGDSAVRAPDLDALLAAPTRTRAFTMRSPIPLEIRYDLVEVDGDSLRLYPDMYRRHVDAPVRHLHARLAAAGYPAAVLDTAALRAVFPTRRARVVPLTTILRQDFRPLPAPRTDCGVSS